MKQIKSFKTKGIIESLRDISTQRINPNFGLIEFNDGIYSIKYDRFFLNKNEKDIVVYNLVLL